MGGELPVTKSKTIKSVDGTKVYYEFCKQNNKLSVVFIHGLGGNMTAWEDIIKYLITKGYSTLTFDLRGHGKSLKLSEPQQINMKTLITDLNEILKKEKIRSIILVGHCFGSLLALVFSVRYPKKVRKLVLLAPPYAYPLHKHDSLKKALLLITNLSKKIKKNKKSFAYTNYSKISDKPYFYFLYRDLKGTPLQSYLQAAHSLLESQITTFLPKIVCPTLILAGDKDIIAPVAFSRELSKKIKNSKLRIIHGGDHIFPIREPEVTAKEILEFVKN